MTKADYGKKGSLSSKRLESTTAIVGAQQQALGHSAEAVAENIHHEPQARDREKWREAERANRERLGFLKPQSPPQEQAPPPPVSPPFLILSKQFHQLGTKHPNTEPIGVILIQTTTAML